MNLNLIFNILATIIWILFASFRLRVSVENGNLLSFLLALQSGIIAYFLLMRRKASKSSQLSQQAFAWFGAIAPLLIRVDEGCSTIGIYFAFAGTIFTTWALLTLGRSFGIAPADRGLVQKGPYKIVRHPMYAGELLVLFGGAISCFSTKNILVFFTLFLTFYLRIRWEEKIITGYEAFKKRVPWRLIPKIW
ncbi:hypothetical protein A2714_02170 [Candidatus Woesebacteria bacterium RIFCSPHIGHO2_01_FULL_38_9]|uniref:Steroid 5-alpha reductase C-terminal domain-containing protein n=2 Tax=Candidatus Woeseibacteriota TaxID=1752722 RepID=A0A1F7Y2Z3_9BACT|nr:MAG: hypothetical protein A2714_02170 [Candidatus Woesebacteria bacterium RIFCSPHIGHO2_01_FULL_38_9]OGM60368.1 MAG: hypothetical protein A3A75_03930 [Candidatus Woesebacteria bacterium RIFCSPLOWO2_01_FULL_39_10]